MPQCPAEEAAGEDLLLYQPGIDPALLERAVLFERTKRAARRTVDAEERELTPIPLPASLADRLAFVRPPTAYRVDRWFVEGGHVLLVAQFKTGKTTLVGNLVRSLVDGDKFLGVAQVRPVESVVMLDFEMSEGQIEDWLRDQKIRKSDCVHLVSLRGVASSFDILQPERRREWAATLRGTRAQFVVLDCLRPAMDAIGLNEHSEAGRWLTAFDEMLKEAGISEALLVHHAGHSGERSRGDSRILDWPDGIWSLVRENKDDLNSARFISAKGRDINVSEGKLHFNPSTRHLTYVLEDRKTAGDERVMDDVLRLIESAGEPMSVRAVAAALKGHHSRASVEAALRKACAKQHGYLSLVKGAQGAHLHSITPAGRVTLEWELSDSGRQATK